MDTRFYAQVARVVGADFGGFVAITGVDFGNECSRDRGTGVGEVDGAHLEPVGPSV